MTGFLRRAVARLQWELVAIVVVAFGARLIYRLALGESVFLNQGYTFYRDLADSFLRGYGFCFDGGLYCAVRVPVYPLLVSVLIHFDWLYPGLPIVQAILSASRCLISYGIGRTLFDRRAGLMAAGLTALNPYSIVHSTAMQETSLFTMLMGLAIYLLLRSREVPRGLPFKLAAGVVLGLATLTTVRLAVFLPIAILWVGVPSAPGGRWRIRQAVTVAMPIVLLVGGWMARNWLVVGAPVLTTEAGVSLWLANNPVTLAYLPNRSVDEIYDVAYAGLPEQRKRLLGSTTGELEVDRLFWQWATEYMRENPGQTAVSMVRKVAWSFSGQLSPKREWWVQWGYAAFFVPLQALALVGWWRSRGSDKSIAHLLIYGLFTAFIITTAVFWAHTSHTSTLHQFLGVYAGFAISHWRPRPREQRPSWGSRLPPSPRLRWTPRLVRDPQSEDPRES